MSNYPEWQFTIRNIQKQAKERLAKAALDRAHQRANQMRNILIESGLTPPEITDAHWTFNVFWRSEVEARASFWLGYQGYRFLMPSPVKDIVSIAKGSEIVDILPYPDSRALAVADAIDKLEALIAQGVEVGAAD